MASHPKEVYCQGNSALKTRLPKRVCFNSESSVSTLQTMFQSGTIRPERAQRDREKRHKQRVKTQAESRDRDKQRVELREVGCHSKKSRGYAQ